MKKHPKKKLIKNMNNSVWVIFLVILACCLVSCAHYPRNSGLKKYNPNTGYRYPTLEETEEQNKLFIALAFSGGGTRAAAFSYGILKKLNEISNPGKAGQTLLQEVDIISSVSGGSFTAAYYGLFKERIFKDFESRFLYRNVQKELFLQLFKPWNWARLLSPYYSRIDMAAELYHETVFREKTYQVLIDNGSHPYIAINATNMSTGDRFTFTQKQFDLIGSDLAKFSVARAVAASSAFPILLSPISLINNEAPSGYSLPVDITLGLKSAGSNDRRYLWAKNRSVYHLDKEDHLFLHLMDGGLADNIGLRYITAEYRRTSGFFLPRKKKIKHLVVIVANARTQLPEKLDLRESAPGLKDMAYKTATVSMDNYSFETVRMNQDLLEESWKAQKNIQECQKLLDEYCGKGHKIAPMGHTFKPYVIELNFLQVKDPEKRKRLLSMPTSFFLEPNQIRELIEVAGELLEQSPKFQDLMDDLKKD